MIEDQWWRRSEAARYLNLAPKTLANMASRGEGPAFKRSSGGLRGGIVRYSKAECDAYVLSSGRAPVR